MPEPDLQHLWQQQPADADTITLDEIHRRATRFHRRLVWRNAREYIAALIVIAILIPHLWRDRGWILAAAILLIAGVVYVVFELVRRAASRLPAAAAAQTWLDYHRTELERQRDALRTVWKWYLLPMLPGLLLVPVGMYAAGRSPLLILANLAALVTIFGGVWRLNLWAANKLDKQIQQLHSLETENE